jgi:hypothetical protein
MVPVMGDAPAFAYVLAQTVGESVEEPCSREGGEEGGSGLDSGREIL